MPTIEEFKQKGYVYFGYISPELSSSDTYPDYIKECVDDCVNKIQQIQNRNTVTLGIMADTHYSHNFNHNIRVTRVMNAYREISKRVHSDNLIVAGDFVNDGYMDYKTLGYKELRAHLKEFDYLPVNGNHDENSIWDEVIRAEVIENRLNSKQVYNLLFNHLPSLGAKFNEKNPGLYYYLDDENRNIRYIFLDICDYPDIHFNTWYMYMAMSQEQIDWLINEALNVTEDTDIIITAHSFAFPSKIKDGTVTDKDDDRIYYLNYILDAYKNGGRIQQKFGNDEFEVNVEADFSNRKRGNIIGCFAGHHHKDIIEYSDSGIPYIYIANFMMYNEPANGLERLDGDKSEMLFDMVTIDRKKRTIYLTRVGAGEDREVNY